MNLYKATDRFMRNYNYLKQKLKRIPSLVEMSEFDHLHYDGIKVVNEAILKCGINDNSTVLDIGSGLGGPARYIANKSNAKVYAVEIQKELTRRNCNILRFSNKITSNKLLPRCYRPKVARQHDF